MNKITLENGKYEITSDNGTIKFYRHGEQWPAADEFAFAGVVVALIDRVIELESKACPDPVVERNVNLLRSRSLVGVTKYGATLADNKLNHKQWLQHLLEELLDGANYIQAALQQDDAKPVVSGVLEEKGYGEFMNYTPGMNSIAACILAQTYNRSFVRMPWRFENGKIVYG